MGQHMSIELSDFNSQLSNEKSCQWTVNASDGASYCDQRGLGNWIYLSKFAKINIFKKKSINISAASTETAHLSDKFWLSVNKIRVNDKEVKCVVSQMVHNTNSLSHSCSYLDCVNWNFQRMQENNDNGKWVTQSKT